ncbi:RNA-directed DNA polymerase from mobile element jockey-like [Elysia marginata]|uniref:RNA-directed DNA polymerase from mobile element jockey-like n=1 Tax=Elysia marginata TaxID=1093978 RepID=A0AAV4JGA1_9GAST|nr:RNA-directed DNA polymerase from mobile element jockey-like [Elysia marginata]
MPCWSERSQELLEEYERTQDHGTAEGLLESLQQSRKERWTKVVENIDFTPTSRHASDMPETNSHQLGYAGDWILTHQYEERTEIDDTLIKDTTALKEYFDTWYLKMNTTKSVSTAFHLNNHEASKSSNIKVKNKMLPSDTSPKYLGAT